MITDLEGVLVYVNPAFEKITGYSREETVGRNPRFLKSEKHDAAFYQGLWDTLAWGESWSGHFINKRKDGTLFEEEAVISPIRDPDGQTVNYVAVKRDVTREVSLQEQLQQAQKMEAVGTLAGGVAHDFNNLLTTIIGYAQIALLDENLKGQTRKNITRIPEQGQRAAKLISQLLTFSRQMIVDHQPMQLLYLVKETSKILGRTIPENISIRTRWTGEVALIEADPTQMQQVILNLCLNASHAMPRGGEMTLGIEHATLDAEYCHQYAHARPGNYVCLWVQDTGMGMTRELQEHIFEPFFTTKKVGKGSGLGLSMVYGIVKAHQGFIHVYSEEGVGSNFKVYLPVADSSVALAEAVDDQPEGGTETLLLVEDEEAVRKVENEMLKTFGYSVLTAENGEEALKIYRSHSEEIALVLSDMVMPKMGGRELYGALVTINPEVKVVLMSGHGMREDVAELRAIGLKEFVDKPLDFNKLGKAVREALDGKAVAT